MKNLLRKINLLKDFTTEIEMSKVDFVSNFKNIVDKGSTGLFASSFDIFSSSNNEYIGRVDSDKFEIKKRRRLFDMNFNLSVVKGTFQEKEDTIAIEAEINGFSGIMIPFFVIVILIYASVFISFLFTGAKIGSAFLLAIPFLAIHATMMLGMPYLMLKRSIKRMEYDLEREFYYLTKAQKV